MSVSYVKATVSFFSPGRGGRPSVPIQDGYAPYIRNKALPNDLAVRVNGMPLNGENDTKYEVTLELTYHAKADYSALVPGLSFELIEGPKVVGEGTITGEMFS